MSRRRDEKKRQQIFELLSAGLTRGVIAQMVLCSPTTVTRVARERRHELPERKPGRPVDTERNKQVLDLVRQGRTTGQTVSMTAVSRTHVKRLVRDCGGMPPAFRKQSDLRLSLDEREEISRGLVEKESMGSMARRLGRHTSTISREIQRNGGKENYRAWAAEKRCHEQAKRPKLAKLIQNPELRREVQQRLHKKHSPRQIALCLMNEFPDDKDMQISHEAIYQSLFIQGRGALRRELTQCLRTGRAVRKPQGREIKAGKIRDMVMISERPAEVDDRAIPGHWEGDLIEGKDAKTHIGTLVERSTRYVMLMKLPDKKAETLRKALEQTVKRLPEELFKSLTWDQGKELADHATFSFNTDVDVYFCDPHSPWQRGSNENTNGLLRQYFPKGTDLSVHSQRKLDAVARELNERPRETLGLKTPAYMLNELIVALTG